MPLPDEMGDLRQTVDLPEILERALNTRSLASHRVADILDELARQMGRISVGSLGEASYSVLWDLLRMLEENVDAEGPWLWTRDIEERRDSRVAEKVASLQYVDDLITAAREFGWRCARIDAHDFSDVAQAIRSAFAALLSDGIGRLLQGWLDRQEVWNDDVARRHRIARTRAENTKRDVP